MLIANVDSIVSNGAGRSGSCITSELLPVIRSNAKGTHAGTMRHIEAASGSCIGQPRRN
jgi:hypothetical protein